MSGFKTKMTIEDIKSFFEENDIKFVDFRFTDTFGVVHHLTYSVATVGATLLTKGVPFDSSSIRGWKPVENSDMLLLPDLSTMFIEPLNAHPTVAVTCDVHDPVSRSRYCLDPRFTATKAFDYAKSLDIVDNVYFGAELEFFIFDDVRFTNTHYQSSFAIDSREHPSNNERVYEGGNSGYRPNRKGGYAPLPPIDSTHDIRSEILLMLADVGINPTVHHHEVACAQVEIGFMYDNLIKTADNVQLCKHIVRNVVASYGKTVTFMPKPVNNDNGSGMHCHQSLWKDGVNLFAGKNGEISDMCRHYIGGILKHGRAINAFANPTTNSYKRLVPNFEAPVMLSYSFSDRTAAIRIPHIGDNNPSAVRIEVRFPDPLANPYLCFAAQLMAGLDGIINKITPEPIPNACEKFLRTGVMPCERTCRNLDEALDALEKDQDFLLVSGVFTREQIDSYIRFKRIEAENLNQAPHPIEFTQYYGG